MNFKTALVSVLIFVFRIIDLYTTQLAIKNFQEEEQNLVVKITGMNVQTFFIMEIILAILLVVCYLFYYKNRYLFLIKATNLRQYINLYFFNKSNVKLKDCLTYFNLKKVLVLVGSCIPFFVITTSTLFSINNYWVGLYNENNQTAIKYYHAFNDYYLFDFIIFVFPVLLILFLLRHNLCRGFLANKY